MMQTQLMDKCAVGVPWLERFAPDGTSQQCPLQSFPFSIGRVASADLQIDDARVSREHAVVLREGTTFRIRDLNSTNGTVLNGQPVQDAPLTDGDILVIADVEFTFYSGQSNTSYSAATQVMGAAGRGTDRGDDPRDIIRAARRLHEMLTHRCVEVVFQPIVDLQDSRVLGYEALRRGEAADDVALPAERLLWATAARISGRVCQLLRMVAVEQAAARHDAGLIFLKIDPSEIGTQSLVDSLVRLHDLAPAEMRLVVELPENVVGDIPYFHDLHARLRGLGWCVAYNGFAGGKAQVLEKKNIPPDYLMLAPSLLQGLPRNAERQRQLEAVVRASRDIGAEVIACGVEKKDEAKTCRDAGCRFAQGDFIGAARPAAKRGSVVAAASSTKTDG